MLYKRSSGQFVCSREQSSREGETGAEEEEDVGLSEQTEGLGSGAWGVGPGKPADCPSLGLGEEAAGDKRNVARQLWS